MKDITLPHINQKLYELDERYGQIYPRFKEIELRYIKKYDKILMQVQNQFTNQASREAAARELISQEQEYEEYNILATEVRVIETRMRNLTTISKNIINISWEGTNAH